MNRISRHTKRSPLKKYCEIAFVLLLLGLLYAAGTHVIDVRPFLPLGAFGLGHWTASLLASW